MKKDKINYYEINALEENFQELVKTDPKYSLEVDPLEHYNLSKKEVEFIEQMVQYKNIQFVSTVIMNIPIQEGIEMYKKYPVQEEIKRINLAMYARRFTTKMADLNHLGGFLTTALVDDNVPIAERLSPKEKLTAAKLLINLNELKKDVLNEPEIIDVVDIQKDLNNLSPNELKKLIEYNEYNEYDNKDLKEKENLIQTIDPENLLSMEEIKNLRSMKLEELKELVNVIKTRKENEEKN